MTDFASRDRIVALDLGTNTGWAIREPDGVIVSGLQKFEPRRFEGAGMRLLRFKRWLDVLRGDGLAQVYFEEVHNHGKAGVATAHLYGGFLGILVTWCEENAVPYAGVGVSTIKKHASGKGNCDKVAMIAAARAHGCNTNDDNEADAFLLLRYVREQLIGEKLPPRPTASPPEQKIAQPPDLLDVDRPPF